VSLPERMTRRANLLVQKMNVTIRQAGDADVPSVHELYMQWVTDRITHGLVQAEPDYFSNRLGAFFLVAVHDKDIIGFVTGTEHKSDGLAVIPEGERYLEVDDLYVVPEHQHQGVGSRLIEAIENKAKAAGISRFLIYSASKDIQGILRFYGQHGYKSWYVQMYK
jgi:GNAT superfamily N-acetyltransferase